VKARGNRKGVGEEHAVKLQPLFFERDVHEAIWGHEEWLVSGHRSSPSVIAGGPLGGRTLEWAAAEFGRAFMGARAPFPDKFPLLFKTICARDVLSVQVHPNETSAPRTGGEAKSEMWYMLDREATLYTGLKSGAGRESVEEAVCSGRFEELVVKRAVQPGGVVMIPGGLVHAIGAGTNVYEVQQSSDTTYRLYDWGRVGVDGRPRDLHIAEALDSIDFSLSVPEPCDRVECPFFRFAPRDVSAPCDFPADEETFRVLHLERGAASIVWEDGAAPLVLGRSVLVPANVAACVEPAPFARLLVTELGK